MHTLLDPLPQFGDGPPGLEPGKVRAFLRLSLFWGLYRGYDGKENGNYRDYRVYCWGYIGTAVRWLLSKGVIIIWGVLRFEVWGSEVNVVGWA